MFYQTLPSNYFCIEFKKDEKLSEDVQILRRRKKILVKEVDDLTNFRFMSSVAEKGKTLFLLLNQNLLSSMIVLR